MSRTASTDTRLELIKQKLKSNSCKSELTVEYYANNNWEYLEDLDTGKGVTMAESSKKYKYANYSLSPMAGSINFSILNKNGKYSEGSGTVYEGLITNNTKIRVKGGYKLKELGAAASKSLPLNSIFGSCYLYTKYNSSSYVELDETNASGTSYKYFTDLFAPYYDAETYDDSTYSADAFYVQTYDMVKKGYSVITKFTLTANNTKGTIYYRLFNDIDNVRTNETTSAYWTSAGSTTNGTSTITVNSTGERFIQIAVVYDGVAWADDLRITDITIYKQTYIEWIFTKIFELDTPLEQDNAAPQISAISCSGRDSWKKALETDYNLQDLTAGVAVTQLIKDVCDVIGMSYTATSIVDLAAFGDRVLSTGYGEPVKAVKVFENILQIINKSGNLYQMYTEYDSGLDDNVLFVQPKPTTYETDYVFNNKYYQTIGARRKNYDRLLKGLAVITDSQVVDAEEQLATDNYTTTGAKTLSWAGEATSKRFTVVNNAGDGVVTLTEINPASMVFAITGTSIDIDITAFGNKWSSTAPTFEGEALDYDNIISNNGSSSRIINPLVISDTEAKNIAEGFINKFGSPDNEAQKLKYPYLNFLLEVNDMCLLWSRNIFISNLYYITGISYNWNIKTDYSTYNLADSGLKFSDQGDTIYDRNDYDSTAANVGYEKGFIYDMVYGAQGQPSDVDTSKYSTNVGTI